MVMGSLRWCLSRRVRSVTRLGEGDDGPVYTDPAGSSDTTRCTCQAREPGVWCPGPASAARAAVLLVAHDINPILSAVDRVVYVAHGQVAIGAPEEVITTETLSRLYATPIEVLRASDGRIVVVGQPEEEVSYHAHRLR